ncbi:hypothetical protein Neosp_012573 [[Neocosmospora] mangrovei]
MRRYSFLKKVSSPAMFARLDEFQGNEEMGCRQKNVTLKGASFLNRQTKCLESFLLSDQGICRHTPRRSQCLVT